MYYSIVTKFSFLVSSIDAPYGELVTHPLNPGLTKYLSW